MFNKWDWEKCMIFLWIFYFVVDYSLVCLWSNNCKKLNECESGGLRVVIFLFCVFVFKSRLILCCVNFVFMRIVK